MVFGIVGSLNMIIHHNKIRKGTMSRNPKEINYELTGLAAHGRIGPLLSETGWTDRSPNVRNNNDDDEDEAIPDFLWENAPRRQTKEYRDRVKVYSHLPNGQDILDSKWVLGRLLSKTNCQLQNPKEEEVDIDPFLATLETHCFRGLDGFRLFCEKVQMGDPAVVKTKQKSSSLSCTKFPDILHPNNDTSATPPPPLPAAPHNLWVVKDAMANGAGGVWVVGPENYVAFGASPTSPLYEGHMYAAQRYTWPPVLFGGRKCHVRVYGLLTADGRAFVHHRAFLHVANDPFFYQEPTSPLTSTASEKDEKKEANGQTFQDSVHITNCCANSHDDSKFAGEILADFEADTFGKRDGEQVIPLQQFFPSIRASVAALAHRSAPFLQGGQANHGFEYMGMDFILSYEEEKDDSSRRRPIAYLLEVNAPPSQDTATGLPFAENLHNQVMSDLLSLWVIPNVLEDPSLEQLGGWRCVYTPPPPLAASETKKEGQTSENKGSGEMIAPSKASIINKIRWAIFERKTLKRDQEQQLPSDVISGGSSTVEKTEESKGTQHYRHHGNTRLWLGNSIASFARSQFPYFTTNVIATCSSSSFSTLPQVFFENAGGSQVARTVAVAVQSSLVHRHRSVIGSMTKSAARDTLKLILGATHAGVSEEHADPDESSTMFLGPNATTLLCTLADKYVRLGLLKSTDEIILSTENHLANVDAWVQAAQDVGARIKWWTPYDTASTKGHHDATDDDYINTSLRDPSICSCQLKDLLSKNTRIVAISHASNILGQIRDISTISKLVASESQGYAHLVVDGVAAAPHWFPNVSELQLDWYVVSCHKLFGPHLGGLYGRKTVVDEFRNAITATTSTRRGTPDTSSGSSSDGLFKLFEMGTVNYEACAGVVGLGKYFSALASVPLHPDSSMPIGTIGQTSHQSSESQQDRAVEHDSSVSLGVYHDSIKEGMGKSDPVGILHPAVSAYEIRQAYQRIRIVEELLLRELLSGLSRSSKVRIIEGKTTITNNCSLPNGNILAHDDGDLLDKDDDDDGRKSLAFRLPVIGMIHQDISARSLLAACEKCGVACRTSTFLCTGQLAHDFGFDGTEGILRISLAHYNTVAEIRQLWQGLESLPGWF